MINTSARMIDIGRLRNWNSAVYFFPRFREFIPQFFNTSYILFYFRHWKALFFYRKSENNLLELKPYFSGKINCSSLRAPSLFLQLVRFFLILLFIVWARVFLISTERFLIFCLSNFCFQFCALVTTQKLAFSAFLLLLLF